MTDETMGIPTVQPHNMKGDLHLIARTPAEMAQCQNDLILWAGRRLEQEREARAEAQENLAIAKRNKWKHSAWLRRVKLSTAKIILYEKLHRALKAGYYIVPPFTAEIFAIRRTEGASKRGAWVERQDYHGRPRKGEHRLPVPKEPLEAGAGEYTSGEPRWAFSVKTHKEGVVRWIASAMEQIDFPMKLVKPQILEATEKALQEKIFDQIGILPPQTRTSDPIVVGQILRPDGREPLTFFIGWWLNTEDL